MKRQYLVFTMSYFTGGSMKLSMSFGYVNKLSDNIFEVVVDEDIEVTLEMVDESHEFVDKYVKGDFALLINRINGYSYTYEAKLSVSSYEGLKAIAFVYYDSKSQHAIEDLQNARVMDKWNAKSFSGLELGWQQAHDWLQKEMAVIKVK